MSAWGLPRRRGPEAMRRAFRPVCRLKSLEKIRLAVQRGQLTGDDRFVEEVAKKLGRRMGMRSQGRPNEGGK